MYLLKKVMDVSGSHSLDLPYESACKNLHGHNWRITVYCELSDEDFELQKTDMIVDFTEIKRIVNQLDHKHINNVVAMNPTAENIAKWLQEQIPHCTKVTVEETANNEVTYVCNK